MTVYLHLFAALGAHECHSHVLAAAADETNPVSTKQNAAAAAGTDPKAKSGSALDATVEEASEAQEYREEPAEKVVAQVVKEEAAVELANGDADVGTTGGADMPRP